MLRIREEEWKGERDRLGKETAAAKLQFEKIAGSEAQYLVSK